NLRFDYRCRASIRPYDIMLQSRYRESNPMGQVVIRNIDDQVLQRLKERAAAERKSLEQSLREILTQAARPSRAELLAEVDRIRSVIAERNRGVRYPTVEQLIREDRDSR